MTTRMTGQEKYHSGLRLGDEEETPGKAQNVIIKVCAIPLYNGN